MKDEENRSAKDVAPASTNHRSGRKIAVIGLTYPFRGGISHHSSLFVRALRRRYDVRFLTLSRQYPGFLFPGKSQYDFSDKTLTEQNDPMIDSMNPISWFRTAAELNRECPDLIVFQWWHPYLSFSFGTIVRLLRRNLQERVCFLCHNVLPHEPNPLQTVLTKFAFRKARFFIVHSESDKTQLRAIQPDAVIKQGCHPTYSEFGTWSSHTKEEARNALRVPENDNTILFFGLIRPYKGLKYLIEAMHLLPDRLNCRLLVAGEFYDEKSQYMSQIESYGLADKIQVVDKYIPNEEVANYFVGADVVVLPYISATQSGIVQIAFGLGTPVITTNVGGLPDAVDDGQTGFIVEANSAQELARAIVKYFDGGFEHRFKAAIEAQAERFDWNNEIALIDECLNATA